MRKRCDGKQRISFGWPNTAKQKQEDKMTDVSPLYISFRYMPGLINFWFFDWVNTRKLHFYYNELRTLFLQIDSCSIAIRLPIYFSLGFHMFFYSGCLSQNIY